MIGPGYERRVAVWGRFRKIITGEDHQSEGTDRECRREAMATVGYLQSEWLGLKTPHSALQPNSFAASWLLFNRSVGPLIARAKSKHQTPETTKPPPPRKHL